MTKKERLKVVGCPTPTTREGGLLLAEARDAVSFELLGGSYFEGVAFTQDQLGGLERWFPIEGEESDNLLIQAGNQRNLMRVVKQHGLRLMAFLASRRFLEEGRDPVLSLAELLEDYLGEPVEDLSEED
jgi:hypothetical protein